MNKQLSIFNTEPDLTNTTSDWIMTALEDLNRHLEASEYLLTSMIDELQKDWTEEEKLQINGPKKIERQKQIELTNEADILKNSTVQGLIVKLPEGRVGGKVYGEVKKKLELIGGKWKGGKICGFEFKEDPTELLFQISQGKKRNLKKEFQFFSTPDGLADRLVQLSDLKDYEKVLEPSAGQGAIVKAIERKNINIVIECCEMSALNISILKRDFSLVPIAEDFLSLEGRVNYYDKIVANPPFSNNQDIDHVMKMWECVKPGGRIITITSKHWQLSANKKEATFRKFLESKGAEVHEIKSGEFKKSGASVATLIIVLNKPC